MPQLQFDKQRAALLTAAWASLEAWAPACASARKDWRRRASPPGWVGPPACRTNSPDFRQQQTHIIAGGECFMSHIWRFVTGVASSNKSLLESTHSQTVTHVPVRRNDHFVLSDELGKSLIKPETWRAEGGFAFRRCSHPNYKSTRSSRSDRVTPLRSVWWMLIEFLDLIWDSLQSSSLSSALISCVKRCTRRERRGKIRWESNRCRFQSNTTQSDCSRPDTRCGNWVMCMMFGRGCCQGGKLPAASFTGRLYAARCSERGNTGGETDVSTVPLQARWIQTVDSKQIQWNILWFKDQFCRELEMFSYKKSISGVFIFELFCLQKTGCAKILSEKTKYTPTGLYDTVRKETKNHTYCSFKGPACKI